MGRLKEFAYEYEVFDLFVSSRGSDNAREAPDSDAPDDDEHRQDGAFPAGDPGAATH
jgi:hypothetical protein